MQLVAQLPTGMEGLHQAGILHRDISSKNVMVDSHEPVWVILNDFDLAGRVEAEVATAQHRTGTLPFMAIELLEEAGAMHRLRHDLESLFYVAVWWAVTGTHTSQADRDRASSPSNSLASWNHGTPGEIGQIKFNLLRRPWETTGIRLSPEFRGIIRILLKLRKLFADADCSRTNHMRCLEDLALGIEVEFPEHAETAGDVSPEKFRMALTS